MTINWRDTAENPDRIIDESARLGWEFLRRSQIYREDWRRYIAQRGFDIDAPAKEGETPAEYKARVVAYSIPLAEGAYAAKYGIHRMADPRRDEPASSWRGDKITVYGELLSFAYGQGKEMLIAQFPPGAFAPGGRYRLPVRAEAAYVEFNLARPRTLQLKRANWVLGMLQADLKRQGRKLMVSKRKQQKRRGLYRTYLQLLDAEEAGASLHEMAAALYRGVSNIYPTFQAKDKVKKALAAAKRLRDGDFLYFLI